MLSDFSYGNIGNILNFIIMFNLIIAVILYLKRKLSVKKPVIIFTFILTITLVVSYISTLIEFPAKTHYYLNQPGDKLLDTVFFSIYLFILFTFTSYLWFKNFESKRFVLIKILFSVFVMFAIFLSFTYLFLITRSESSNEWKLNKSEKNIAVVLGSAVWSGNLPSPSLPGK